MCCLSARVKPGSEPVGHPRNGPARVDAAPCPKSLIEAGNQPIADSRFQRLVGRVIRQQALLGQQAIELDAPAANPRLMPFVQTDYVLDLVSHAMTGRHEIAYALIVLLLLAGAAIIAVAMRNRRRERDLRRGKRRR